MNLEILTKFFPTLMRLANGWRLQKLEFLNGETQQKSPRNLQRSDPLKKPIRKKKAWVSNSSLEPQTAIHLLVVGYQLDDFHQFFT